MERKTVGLLVIMLASSLTVVGGCSRLSANRSIIRDYELYDSGEPKTTIGAADYKALGEPQVSLYSYTSEYFKNGRLKCEQWSANGRKQMKLEFYEDGRLKSEERYLNKEVAFGAYYDEEGRPVKTVGNRLF